MPTVVEAEEVLLGLPDSDRAKFAEKLISTLPSAFVEEDEE